MIKQGGAGCCFVYGRKTIEYDLHFCQRKTMEIAVHPGGDVVVKVPIGVDLALVEARLQKKARWIIAKMDYFRQFSPKMAKRAYVSGETHLYLGKHYRLKIRRGQRNEVKLSGGFFEVFCFNEPTPVSVKRLLDIWYAQKAEVQFAESLERCWARVKFDGCSRPTLVKRRHYCPVKK